ncbi:MULTISPECIES: RidA family protein [unclassified Corynebacterium]|uniref:RidA family protein n=1 Tax=unclassified Corynebacterium TaxID=2624378 RepID=UPI002169193C|nr:MULTISPECIES: RidA family protein [unclassified Corynebacterium]MCS4490091.1 RidA family protein [Corynebacterium sp. ES2775-CONJ]MCS4532208.1 RidA family protein [Corynebacterium sp. ES2730-CONJ]
MRVSEKLAELGLSLPAVVPPLASYVPAVQVGNQVWTAGQLPMVDGVLPRTGKVGADLSVDEAYELARTSALNALSAADALVGIDRIRRVFKVVGFVSSAPGFADQALVINGASHMIGDIFGDQGIHARSAVGVSDLPLNSPVEVELYLELD